VAQQEELQTLKTMQLLAEQVAEVQAMAHLMEVHQQQQELQTEVAAVAVADSVEAM
jgi:hypothetical protein